MPIKIEGFFENNLLPNQQHRLQGQDTGGLLIILDHFVFVEHTDGPAVENHRCPTSSGFAGGVS